MRNGIVIIFLLFALFQVCLCGEPATQEDGLLSRFLTVQYDNSSIGTILAVVSFFVWAVIMVLFISNEVQSTETSKSDFVRDVEYQQLSGSKTSGWSDEILAALGASEQLDASLLATDKKADVLTAKIDAPSKSKKFSTFNKRQSRLNPRLDRRQTYTAAERRTDDEGENRLTQILRAARNIAPSITEIVPAISGLSSAVNEVSGMVSDLSTSMTSRVARLYENTNIQDCLLQTVCYLSVSPSNFIESRNLQLKIPFQKRSFSGRSDELSNSDCQVFECTAATVGHRLYTVYRGVSGLAERLSSNEDENNENKIE